MRALITGGPGSGCTSTAAWLAKSLGMAHFDSDRYFHKPTDPPYQEQYSPEERRELIGRDLQREPAWILSGSVATWELGDLRLTHAVMLDVGSAVRLKRLAHRERQRFGARVEAGGDMQAEHENFMTWAEGYETRSGRGRNRQTDLEFIRANSPNLLEIQEEWTFDQTCERVGEFLANAKAGQGVGPNS